MNKQSKVLAIGFVVCTTLLACNGGGNNNSSLPAAPNTQNQLQKYLSLWRAIHHWLSITIISV